MKPDAKAKAASFRSTPSPDIQRAGVVRSASEEPFLGDENSEMYMRFMELSRALDRLDEARRTIGFRLSPILVRCDLKDDDRGPRLASASPLGEVVNKATDRVQIAACDIEDLIARLAL